MCCFAARAIPPPHEWGGFPRKVMTATTLASPEASALEPSLYSQDSEQLIVSIMLNPSREKLHHRLSELLAPDDFFVEQNKSIWSIFQSLRDAGQPLEAASLIDSARRNSVFIGGSAYVVDCVNNPLAKNASDEAVQAAASRIKEYSMLRRLQASLRQGVALAEAGQPFASVLSFVEDDIANLRRVSSTSRTGPQHATVFLNANMERLAAKLEDPDAKTDVIPTGFMLLDRVIGGGFSPGTFIVVAARPAMGKTAFLVNVEQNIATLGRPTLTFTLEMKGESITGRALARHSRVAHSDIKQGAVDEEELSRIVESISYLGSLNTYIDETSGLTLPEIRARARAWAKSNPAGIILIDYLQLIASAAGSKDRNAHITEVSMALRNLARELNVPVVALSQLNRSLESRANKRPMLSDLRESGQIEQDAEIIIFLYRDEVYNPDTPDKGITEVIIGKNRDGETATVRMTFDGPTMRMNEVGVYDEQ